MATIYIKQILLLRRSVALIDSHPAFSFLCKCLRRPSSELKQHCSDGLETDLDERD